MTLQYRVRGSGPSNTGWQWRDVPTEGLPFSWGVRDGNFYWSSLVTRDEGTYDLEVREKLSFEPGYFVLVQDVRADGSPWLVKWFDENPGNDWDRAVIVNDHLD